MTVSWQPVIAVDMAGSLLTLALAGLCYRSAWQWSRRKPDHIFRNYILLLTLSFVVFAVSRSFGHLLKQVLIMHGLNGVWSALSPFSGAINSATFVIIFAFGIYFHRFQTIQTEMESYQDNLEQLIVKRTSELEQKNRDLIESRVALDNVLNSSIPICITSTDFSVVLANRSYQQLWPKGDGPVKCYEQRPGSLCHTPLCPLQQIIDGRDDVMIETTKVIGGEERTFIITARPHTNAAGELLGTIESFQDITVWKKAADERTLLERQLRQAQKMEAIGTMAGGIAHDFNNILTAIIGFAELGKIRAAAGGDCGHFFTEVLRAGERAKDLVKHILTFSNRSERTKTSVPINLVVKEVLKLVRASSPSTIAILEDLDKDCGHIFSDPTQIHQVLMNLCTNAVQEMEGSGGILTVALYPVNLTPADIPADSELLPGRYAAITIGDTGRGIPNNIRDKIFDPYFTTKPVNKGTGLGLAVAQGIVNNHGGAISFESQVGKGTTFQVLLPLLPAAGQVDKPVEEPLAGGSEHILLVDDEPAIVEVLQNLLCSLGYRVTTFTDSLEALEAFRAEPGRYNLVITDQTMPAMTGLELARELTSIRSGLPVILCTGYSRDIDADTAQDHGISGFAMKPVSFRDMARLIRSALD